MSGMTTMMMDEVLKRYAPDSLPLAEQARLGCLPTELSIAEIAYLSAGEESVKRQALITAILKAAKEGKLAVYGNPDGWFVQTDNGPFPRAIPHKGNRTCYRRFGETTRRHIKSDTWRHADQITPYYDDQTTMCYGDMCLVQRDDFRGWLESLNNPLPAWWFPEADHGDDLRSDAALGATIREQRKTFANRNQERSTSRKKEWQRWSDEANRIQSLRIRKTSKQELARMVKTSLNLPDTIQTISKRIRLA